MKRIIIYIFVLFSQLASQADPIQFEQGGASQSVGIIPSGHLQLETVLLNYNKGASSFELAETLFRYGLYKDRLELRTRLAGLSFLDNHIGMDNIGLGTKIGLSKASGLQPSADVIIDFQIPLHENISSDAFVHSYKLVTDSPINSNCSISTNLALVFADTQGIGSTRTFIPYTLGFNTRLNDKLAFNNDLFGTWSMSGELGNSLGLATYLSYHFQDNLVGVMTTAFGFNDNTEPFSFLTGIVYRF